MYVECYQSMREAIDHPELANRRIEYLRKNVERLEERGEICDYGAIAAFWALDALDALIDAARQERPVL